MIDLFMWLCKTTGHLVCIEYQEKSEGNYDHCQICGTLIKTENDT